GVQGRSPWGESPQAFDYIRKLVTKRPAGFRENRPSHSLVAATPRCGRGWVRAAVRRDAALTRASPDLSQRERCDRARFATGFCSGNQVAGWLSAAFADS